MDTRPAKNVSAKTTYKGIGAARAVYQGYAKAALKAKKSTAHYEGASMRRGGKGKDRSHTDLQVTFFDPLGTNQVLPREYYTTLHSTYAGIIATTAGDWTGGALAPLNMVSNDAYRPFANWTPTWFSWVNGVSPTALSATNYSTLLSASLYTKCIVLATEIKITFSQSDTSNNDSLYVTLTPTLDNVSLGPPQDVVEAWKQPFTKSKTILCIKDKPQPIKCYTDWGDFLGYDRKVFEQDTENAWSSGVTAGGVYTSPSTFVYTTLNINMCDEAAPSLALPYELSVKHYVRYYDFTDANITP